jgi:hypothetical protein
MSRALDSEIAAAHRAAEAKISKRLRQFYGQEIDNSNFQMRDAHGKPLNDDNDPLLEAFKKGLR